MIVNPIDSTEQFSTMKPALAFLSLKAATYPFSLQLMPGNLLKCFILCRCIPAPDRFVHSF